MRAFPTTIGAGGDIGLAQQHIDVPVSVQARPHSFTPSGWFPMLQKIQEVAMQIGAIVVGKPRQIRLTLACLFARGHLLLEDLPGVGKTTLAHTLARSLGLDYKRIQFTNDLLPADITGSSVYQRQEQRFSFMPGPVFTQMLLADEINRASPKSQSALLEAMEERQVSVEGVAHRLPEPFFVIATQNPQDQIGTFPLPESQLDRFLMCVELGYPDPKSERAILEGRDRRDRAAADPESRHRGEDLRPPDRLRAEPAHPVAALVDVRRGTEPAGRPGAAARRPRLGAAGRPQPCAARRRAGRAAAGGRTSPEAGARRRHQPPRPRRAGGRAAEGGGHSLT